MRLTVVGCAGSYPNPSSAASCYLIEHDGAAIVLDLGNGSLGDLQQYLDPLDESSLAAVVLSHCHVDHCADVASLYVMRHHGPTPDDDAVAPARAVRHAGADRCHLRDGGREGARPAVRRAHARCRPVGRRPVHASSRCGPRTRSRPTRSGSPPTGCPSPTRATPLRRAELVDLARGTDIALFEASFVGTDNPPNLHLTGAEAGRIASEADAGLLLLTHHVAWNDEAEVLAEAMAEFDGPIEQARAGMTIDLS